ncbi:TonB-dependent receptor [Halocola ammonii]
MKNFTALLLCFYACVQISLSQSKEFSISGKVIDKSTGEALPGASVKLHETKVVTSTGLDGEFTLSNVRNGLYHLHATFVGYKAFTKEVRVNEQPVELEIELSPTSVELQEAIVESDILRTDYAQQSQDVEVAGDEFLRQESGNTLMNSLSTIPGVQAMNVGVGIAKPMIRGMSANRVQVNDQGVTQQGQQWGMDHGLEIDQFSVQRMEIVKGASSLLYGSDGIGGVINLLPAAIPEKNSFSGQFTAMGKTNNDFAGGSLSLQGNRDGLYFNARASFSEFGDYKVPAEEFTYLTRVLDIEGGALKNTAGTEKNLSLAFGLLESWGNVQLSLSRFDQKMGLFPGIIGIPTNFDLRDDGDSRDIELPYQTIVHDKALLNANIALADGWLDLDLGYQRNTRQERTRPHQVGNEPIPSSSEALFLELSTISGNVRWNRRWSEKLKTITGISGEFQENEIGGWEFLIPRYQSYSAGGFAFAEWRFRPAVTLNGGLRYDVSNINSDRYRQPIFNNEQVVIGLDERAPELNKSFSNVSAGAGMAYHPSDQFNFKLNLGKSFRWPVAAELASNGVHHGTYRHEKGDPDLNAEEGYQADITLLWLRNHLQFKVTPFFGYFENFIYLRPAAVFSDLPEGGQVYQYSQADAINTGLETNLDWHVIEPLHLQLTSEYVFQANLETGLPIPFTPPLTVRGTSIYEKKSKLKWLEEWSGGASVQVSGAQNRVDRNEDPTSGYTLLAAFVSAGFKLGKQPMEILFRVDNLLDTKYTNHLSRYKLINLPEQGRNFTATINIPFTF